MRKKNIAMMIVMTLVIWGMVNFPISANESTTLTIDQIIAKCAEAMGGKTKIDAIKTIRFEADFEAHKHPVIIEIKRPNLMRNSHLVFNGKRAANLKPKPAKDGKPKGPQLVKEEYWPHFEIDIAFIFPAFFDYPAQYEGLVEEEGRKAYKLIVKLPLGIPMTYFLDAETFLPFKVFATVIEGGQTFHPERIFENYKEINGIMYPGTLFFRWGTEPSKKGIIKKVDFNTPFKDEYFMIPEDVK